MLKLGQRKQANAWTRGFTILEALISVFVVIVGIGGVHAALVRNISHTSYAASKFVAIYLAQEGVEIVRAIRDTNWVKEIAWDTDIAQGDSEAIYSDILLSGDYNGDFLKIAANNFYNYSLGDTTQFKRKITISDQTDLNIGSDGFEKMTVTVEVTWEGYSVSIKDYLYDWR